MLATFSTNLLESCILNFDGKKKRETSFLLSFEYNDILEEVLNQVDSYKIYQP